MSLRTITAAVTIAALVGSPVAATARSADSLRDLIGVKGGSAESDMEGRGWVLTDGHSGNHSSFTYWWNPSRRDCVMVATRDGRYSSISDVTPGDCNQKGHSSSGAAAGTAAGAVALVALAAALSHKSGHHASGSHYSDDRSEADYESGYNDGMHNQAYRNAGRGEAYGSGYQNGVEQRQRNLDGYSSGGGRYGRPGGDIPDLVGDRAAGAESEMLSQGFRNVDGFQSGNGKGTVWWNRSTRQCLQMIVVDGRVETLNDIGTHPACR